MMKDATIFFMGVRHHGPGSAASVKNALMEYQPDIVLIEGAPEAQELISHVLDNELVPPVAQLVYADDDYRDSAFYPFTVFSPEWQALTFAQSKGITAKFFDLPLTHSMALAREKREQLEPGEISEMSDELDTLDMRQDPLDSLASAAGFSDGERWWEYVVEQQENSIEVFSAIADAMGAVRESIEDTQSISYREQLREAWMRKQIRVAKKDGYEKIAVVCGAWHVPALIRSIKVKDDNALLKSLPKIKLKSTWIPWSYGRISYRSGYGAGVNSPGWYHHLWEKSLSKTSGQDDLVVSWLTLAARTLRDQGYDVAPASVIDGVRLVNSLASIRNSPKPSLDDMSETIQTLFCFGDQMPMALLRDKMLINDRLGTVPSSLPKSPLQQDFANKTKKFLLKLEAVKKQLELDLRKPIGLNRSTLFYQLQILGIKWAESARARSKGTFKEVWTLQWEPEFELELIEKSVWGNTIESAAGRFALDSINKTSDLDSICKWLDKVLLAQMSEVIPKAIEVLNSLASVSAQVEELMSALPRLVKILRYGDVRNTDNSSIQHVINGFIVRICTGFPNHCRSVDDDAAKAISDLMIEVNESISLLDHAEYLDNWFVALNKVRCSDSVHGLIAGRSYRIMLNADRIDADVASAAFSYALSTAEEPQHAADWIEGLLLGAGINLVHDDRIWSVMNTYLCGLKEDRFTNFLPLIRRTFSSFSEGEKNNLLNKAKVGIELDSLSPLDNDLEKNDIFKFDHNLAKQSIDLTQMMLGIKV
jgi:hypothetical protein